MYDAPSLLTAVTDEDVKSAPFSSLPQHYTDQPTSYHAVNTYIVEEDRDEADADDVATLQTTVKAKSLIKVLE